MIELGTHYELNDLGNGHYSHAQYLRSIAYQSNGVMRRITNKLGASGDPNLAVGVDELVQFRLRDRLAGNSPIWHFGKGASMVRMTPLGTDNVQGIAIGESGWLYPEAWNSADLRLTIAGHRLQKDVILRAGHPVSFSFRIDDHIGLNPDTLETADFRLLDPVLIGSNGENVSLVWEKSTQGGKLILTVNLPAGSYAGWLLDPTITLQPDATDGQDTCMFSDLNTWNFGAATRVNVGKYTGVAEVARGLIRFNLATLPSGAIISSAILSLFLEFEWATNPSIQAVYRQQRAWVEGTRAGALDAPPTGATWNRYDTVNNWATAGGFAVADCEQVAIGSRNFTATETLNEFKNWTLTPTTKAALDLGNGWMVKSTTEIDDYHGFASSDNVIASRRPKLVIDYTLPVAGDAIIQKQFATAFRGAFG